MIPDTGKTYSQDKLQGKFGHHKRGTLETDLQPMCRAKPAVGDPFEHFAPIQCERGRFIRQHATRSTVRVHQVIACPVIKSAVILLELHKCRCHDVLGYRIPLCRGPTHTLPPTHRLLFPLSLTKTPSLFVVARPTQLQQKNRSTKEPIKSLMAAD